MKRDSFLKPHRSLSKSQLSGISLLATSTFALAQEAQTNALKTYVIDGGPTMFLILIVILALLALVVFNFMNITKAKYCPADLKNELLECMGDCRVQSAIQTAAAHPSYLGRMMAYALPNVDATQPEDLGRESVEEAATDFAINENRKSMVWINYISLVAQAAPMVGLFGTVLGMVAAFATLASSGQADPSQLASNISTALLTTLWGLVTAIPALVFYYYFKNKLNSLVAECQKVSEELVNASLERIHGEGQLAKIPEGLSQ